MVAGVACAPTPATTKGGPTESGPSSTLTTTTTATPPCPVQNAGLWTGTWQSSVSSTQGTVDASVGFQSAGIVGEATFNNAQFTLSGQIQCSTVTLQLSQGQQQVVTLDGTLSANGSSISGTYVSLVQNDNGTFQLRYRYPAVAVTASGVYGVSYDEGHACAVTTGDGVKCWGGNVFGELGDGTRTDRSVAVDVVGLTSGVTAVATGNAHTCALTTGGGVKCWGDDSYGQLGRSVGVPGYSATPLDVPGLASGVTAISAGDFHTCALTTAGTVTCWGLDDIGELGDGSINSAPFMPHDVVGLLPPVTAISAGGYHTCALNNRGDVRCWGQNTDGQLGNYSYNNANFAIDVAGLSYGVTAISAGAHHTCAVTTSGGVKCWGSNAQGQLGNNTTTNTNLPVDVVGLNATVTAVSAGGFNSRGHTCALTSGGAIKCWGSNTSGELGNGTTTDSHTPVNVSGITSGATALSAGGTFTCAVVPTNQGTVECWGSGTNGKLGDASTGDAWSPVQVQGNDFF
jgi:alpha-tubulin suppressor-like RCC1 family protein